MCYHNVLCSKKTKCEHVKNKNLRFCSNLCFSSSISSYRRVQRPCRIHRWYCLTSDMWRGWSHLRGTEKGLICCHCRQYATNFGHFPTKHDYIKFCILLLNEMKLLKFNRTPRLIHNFYYLYLYLSRFNSYLIRISLGGLSMQIVASLRSLAVQFMLLWL